MSDRYDSYTGDNSPNSIATRTPSDGGSIALVYNGVFGIDANALYCSLVNAAGIVAGSTRAHVVYETGTTVGKIVHVLSGNIECAVIIRFIDINNFWFLYVNGAAVQLYRLAGGTLQSMVSGGGGWALGDILELSVNAANQFMGKKNGVNSFAVLTDAANSTGTKVGFRAYNTTARYPELNFVDANGVVINLTGAGSTQGNTSSSGSISIPASNTITPTDIANNKGFQRVGTSAIVPFSGTNTGEVPHHIQVKIYEGATVVQDWTTLSSATISASNYSGVLSVPQGGMYTFAVRSRDVSNNVLATSAITTNLWGVGALVPILGSSWAVIMADSGSGTGLVGNPKTRRYQMGTGWQPAGTVGAVVTLANEINELLGVPVWIIACGQGGIELRNLANPAHANFTSLMFSLNAAGGKFEFVGGISIGSNDASVATVASKAAHLANYQALISNLRTSLGQPDLPFFVSATNGRTSDNNESFDMVREAEKELAFYPNTYYAATTIDRQVSSDQTHLDVAGYQVNEVRLFNAIDAVYGDAEYYRGPSVTAFEVSGTTGAITVTHNEAGTDLTVASRHGFTVTDAGIGAVTIANGGVTVGASAGGKTQLIPTFSRAIVPPAVLKYASGARPFELNQGVHDNTALALPLEVEADGINAAIHLSAGGSTQGNTSTSGGITLPTPVPATPGVDFNELYSCTNGVTVVDGNWVFPETGITEFDFIINTLPDAITENAEYVDVTAQGITARGLIKNVP
jgi:hypothetical protein